MSSGSWGWKGAEERSLEFPGDIRSTVSPAGRARLRYHPNKKSFEVSVNGSAYQPTSQPFTEALTQTNFYINATTGSDENDGATSGTALKTWGEYARRIGRGVVSVAQTVHIETDLDEPVFEVSATYVSGLTITGTRTVVGSGSVTAVQDYDATVSPGKDGQITDTAIPTSWTASGYVGKLIVLTSGASSGNAGWVIKDLGTKKMRHSPFWGSFGQSVKNAAVGNTYNIVDLPTLSGGELIINCWGLVYIDNLKLAGKPAAWLAGYEQASGFAYLNYCEINGYFGYCYGGAALSCYGTMFRLDSGKLVNESASSAFYGCCFATRIELTPPGVKMDVMDCVWQAGLGPADSTFGQLCYANSFFDVPAGHWAAFFDENSATAAALQVRTGAVAQLYGKLWGLNWDAGFGVWVDSGGTLIYKSGDNFTAHADVQGAAPTEVWYAGTSTTYAGVGTVGVADAVRGARIAPGDSSP